MEIFLFVLLAVAVLVFIGAAVWFFKDARNKG